MNKEEDDASEEQSAQLSLSVLNFKLKSICSGEKDPNHTLNKILVPSSSDQPKGSQVDALDSTLYVEDTPLETYDDSQEEVLIPDLPMSEACMLFLHYILSPLTAIQEFNHQVAVCSVS
jgi:hypothetical protein